MTTISDQELAKFLAEKLMGYTLKDEGWWLDDTCFYIYWKHWNPLLDANQTLMVVEKMREQGYSVEIGDNYQSDNDWYCVFQKGTMKQYWGIGQSLIRATCLAAYEALKGEG